MSLKAFHIVFIIASIALSAGFSWWGFSNYNESRSLLDLIYGSSGAAVAVGLLIYGKYFLRKLKHISYL